MGWRAVSKQANLCAVHITGVVNSQDFPKASHVKSINSATKLQSCFITVQFLTYFAFIHTDTDTHTFILLLCPLFSVPWGTYINIHPPMRDGWLEDLSHHAMQFTSDLFAVCCVLCKLCFHSWLWDAFLGKQQSKYNICYYKLLCSENKMSQCIVFSIMNSIFQIKTLCKNYSIYAKL